jgi:cystathionine beta-lyase/cystathionine gamma-synthase
MRAHSTTRSAFDTIPPEEVGVNQRSKHAVGVDTRAVHGGDASHPGAVSTPIVHSATFGFPDFDALLAEREKGPVGSYYQRDGHPTLAGCERRLAALEESETALLFPSGMAAISCTFLSRLKAGDHVVALHQCYGGTHGLLQWGAERLGWRYDLVDAREPETWDAAFKTGTKIFHVESPTNPTLAVVDLANAAQLAHRRGAWLTVDNTVASPIGQHPLELGADVVLYSATKSIGGHSDLLAGAVMGSAARIAEVAKVREIFGPVPDPDTAWMIERSLKTMPLRVRAANANALELATRLARHAAVAQVFYPGLPSHPSHAIAARQMTNGFGPLLGFEVKGGAEAALQVVNQLKVIKHGASLGGVESLASLPVLMSHTQLDAAGLAAAGIPEGLVRLSVGVEDDADLWTDLEQALQKAATVKV